MTDKEADVRRYLRATWRRVKRWLDETDERATSEIVPFDNTYEWINATFEQFVHDAGCSQRKQYLWGVLQGAAIGKVLGLRRISVIEFGVAYGEGLLALERVAELVEEVTGIAIEVYGFDTGSGLPRPQDYRDSPHFWREGQFPMPEGLERRLRRASLHVGLVEATVPAFLRSTPAPVAFVAFDLDLYSSTRDALRLLEAEHDRLLPRIVCFFDDITGFAYNDFCGERLAISEFNASHAVRKLSPIYGLKFFVPNQFMHDWWPDLFYFAHIFDHPLYNQRDHIGQ